MGKKKTEINGIDTIPEMGAYGIKSFKEILSNNKKLRNLIILLGAVAVAFLIGCVGLWLIGYQHGV